MITLLGGCDAGKITPLEGCVAQQSLRLGVGTRPKMACQDDQCLVAWDAADGVHGAVVGQYGELISELSLSIEGNLVGVALDPRFNGGFTLTSSAVDVGGVLTERTDLFAADLTPLATTEESDPAIISIGTVQQYLVGTSAEGIIFRQLSQTLGTSTPVVLFPGTAEVVSMSWQPGALGVLLRAGGEAVLTVYSGLGVHTTVLPDSFGSEPIVVAATGENLYTAFWKRADGGKRFAVVYIDGTIVESGETDIPAWTRRLARVPGGFAGVTAAEGLVKTWTLDQGELALNTDLSSINPAEILGGQTTETYAFTTPTGFSRILTPVAVQCGTDVCVDLASTSCQQTGIVSNP
jgi:hypothetical protein